MLNFVKLICLEQYNLKSDNVYKLIKLNNIDEFYMPIVVIVIMQLIAFHVSVLNVFVFEELEKFTYEMFSVISWVFMWAAVETLTLELIQILIEIKKSKKLLKSNLTFTKK